MLRDLFRRTLAFEPNGPAAGVAPLLLRVIAGSMLFVVHGVHKLEGGIAYLQDGTPWKLAEEVAGMHAPMPVASAFAATLIQFICSALLVIGLFTRINAILLVAALCGAILQNLLAERDPQLAILYTLIMLALAILGGGRISLDAWLVSRSEQDR